MKASTSALVALLALCAFSPGVARAEETVPADSAGMARAQPSVIADLVVNGTHVGGIEFATNDEGMMLLPESAVRSALAGVARPSTIETLVARNGTISSWDLERAGIHCLFDAQTLVLEISVEPKAMESVPLAPWRTRAPEAPRAALAPEPVSLITGIGFAARPRRDEDTLGSRSSVPLELTLAPALNVLGLALEGRSTMVWEGSTYTRDVDTARAVLDFPSAGARLMAGTVDNRPISFQGGASLIGVSFARESGFPGSDPRVRRDTGDIELTRPATVSASVNGTAIRTVTLAPGTYHVADLPLAQGLNDVSIRVEEQGLPAREIRLGVPFDPAILGPGETDYAVALGVDRPSTSRPFGSLWLSLGLPRDLEVGVDYQATYGRALAGASLLWATPAGAFGLSGASAVRHERTSAATASPAAKASWRLSFPAFRYVPSAGLAAEWRGKDFIAPSADGTDGEGTKDPTLILSAQLSESLPGKIGSVSAYADSSFVGGKAESLILQLGYFLTTRGYVSLSASGGAEWRSPGTTEPRASIAIAWTPPGAPSIQYRNDPVAKTDSLDASMVMGHDGSIGVGAHYSSLAWAAQGERSAGATGRYSGDALAASTAFFYGSSDEMGTASLAGDLSASTSLAFAGRHLAFGNPRSESFAILAPSESLSGTRIALRSADGPLTESDHGRAAMIRGLRLYRPYSATVELPSSDADRMPYPAAVSLVPGYKTVTVVTVALAPSASVRGVAVDAGGKPLVGLSGDLLDGAGNPLPDGGTFTDEFGAFECYGLSGGRHAIRLSDGSIIHFSVPEGMTEGALDLGRVAAEVPERGEGE